MAHRTTRFGGSRTDPYATSLRQWSNFMRVLDERGLTVAELERRTGSQEQLEGMRRWGYVTIAPDHEDTRAKPPARDHVVTPTAKGRRAQEVWRPLPETIETRWRERFGSNNVQALRDALQAIKDELGLALPQFLTQHYGGYVNEPPKNPPDDGADPLPLSALLSQVLHAFALEYERDAKASLCYSANILRLLDEDGIKVAQLPRRSGVAVEQIRTALGILAKRGFITVASDPQTRARQARLTANGLEGRDLYRELPGEIEAHWEHRFDPGAVARLRTLLEGLATATAITPGSSEPAPLWLGLEPPPGTWRSQIPPPAALPHFPMPRQSGHPDGA
jgi:hypothetical protein